MGQYFIPVNLDKKEFIMPHKLASGLKLWEQLAGSGVGQALVILQAAHREQRGGGDLDLKENWHGPERVMSEYPTSPGPMPEDYATVARRTIGRWAGDRVVLVGDYAEDSDLPEYPNFSKLYSEAQDNWEDVTDDVCRVIEHELNGEFTGTGWREFVRGK